MKKLITLFILISITTSGFSQVNNSMMKAMKDLKGRVYGKVLDSKTKKPVEFASVVVLWYNKDTILNGVLAKDNGEFNIENLPPMGGFRLKISQIGYKTSISKFFIQVPNKLEVDLGDMKLEPDEKLLNEVEVTTQKSSVNLSIDKRVYNVDKDLSVKGGTGVDVMKNVPGVTVDADGNAQLRNQSPIIFVDGRPSNLTLQQIPADQIDRVEIITNPSVKFDANATGGILNIIMKKNLKPGYNGMAMAYIGTSDRYGGMMNLNVKEGKWNFSGMYSYNQQMNRTKGFTNRTQLDTAKNKTVTGYFNQENNTNFQNVFNFGRLGIDYNINIRNMITLSGMVVSGKIKSSDDQSFELLDKDKVSLLSAERVNEQFAKFYNYNAQLMYKKTYPKVGKELTADVSYNRTLADNGFLFSTYLPNLPVTLQNNKGGNNAHQGVFQLDFVNPITETKKFEAGVKAYYKQTTQANTTSNYSYTKNEYVKDSAMSNIYVIDDMINAAYVNYNSTTFWGIGYQAGLRFEQSYYLGNITDKNISFSYNYPSTSEDILKSIFPGIYFSKKLAKQQELQLNFSRKIQRPNFFQLMPVVMFADAQNYRIGNPQLRPEFKNIAELNYNKIFEKGNYLGSGYFRYEEQPITDVAYPDPNNPNVLVNTTVNGSNSIRYGMEHTFKYTLFKNLDVMLNANAFYIYLRGLVVPTEPIVTATGYAYNVKSTISYKFPKNFTLQMNGSYESPRILLLGYSQPNYGFDVSVNKMIGVKWILNATVSDVMNTRRMGTYYETPFYIQELSRRRENRFFRFTVTYLFGKMDASIFKRGKQMKGMGDQNQGNQDGLDFGK